MARPAEGSERWAPAAAVIAQSPDGSIWFDYAESDDCDCGVGHIVGNVMKRFVTSTCGPWGIAVGPTVKPIVRNPMARGSTSLTTTAL
jgi:hypothetical protein